MSQIHPPKFLSTHSTFDPNNTIEIEKISDSVIQTTETWVNDPIRPYIDAGVVTAKKGFQWITIWKLHDNFITTKIIDSQGKLVGTYWDVTSEIIGKGDLFEAYDWYLDILKTNDGKIRVLDEDELELSVQNRFLTEQESIIAKNTVKNLLNQIKSSH